MPAFGACAGICSIDALSTSNTQAPFFLAPYQFRDLSYPYRSDFLMISNWMAVSPTVVYKWSAPFPAEV